MLYDIMLSVQSAFVSHMISFAGSVGALLASIWELSEWLLVVSKVVSFESFLSLKNDDYCLGMQWLTDLSTAVY